MTKKPYQFHSPAHRGNYTYDLIGTLQSQKLKRNPQYQQHYYQLQISCENLPNLTKIFVFKSKTSPKIWLEIEQGDGFGSRYHFLCRNYQGHYYLVDWQELNSKKSANGKPNQKNPNHERPK